MAILNKELQISIAKDFLAKIDKKDKKTSSEEDYLATCKEEFLQKLFPEYDFILQPKGCIEKDKVDLQCNHNGKTIFYLEAKSYGDPLPDDTEQLLRYRSNYKNLVYTNFDTFKFYKKQKDGSSLLILNVSLKELGGVLFEDESSKTGVKFVSYIVDQIASYSDDAIPIGSSKELAILLANKAKELDELIQVKIENNQSKVIDEYELFKKYLLTDLSKEEFSSLYAQIIIYGLSYARIHALKENATFELKTASEHIPSIHYLLKFFLKTAITDNLGEFSSIDSDLQLLLDSIVSMLNNTSKDIMSFDTTHFYEEFLVNYNRQMRKDKGVWYTPEDVVDYMIKSADVLFSDRLKINDGICSTDTYIRNGVKEYKVQILDPATGTGNYIRRIVKYIHSKMKDYNWSLYSKNLLDRFNAFELMIIAYTLARLNLLDEFESTGVKFDGDSLNVFLTDTLSPANTQNSFLGATHLLQSLVEENKQATITRKKPISLVIGNPPYLGASTNKSDFIMNLISAYGKGKVNDDYIKFMRYGQHIIDNTGFGVLAYITNNSFLMSPTMRGVRESLLKSFDEIYILNFKGENVFDIYKTVCISFFVKTGKKKPNDLGKVFYKEVGGTREEKLEYCREHTILSDSSFVEIKHISKELFFNVLTEDQFKSYNDPSLSFSISDLFPHKLGGITTSCDDLVISTSKVDLQKNIGDYLTNGILPKNTTVGNRRLKAHLGKYSKIQYRCYDVREYYDSSLTSSPMENNSKHSSIDGNFFISFNKTPQEESVFSNIYISKEYPEHKLFKGSNPILVAPYQISIDDPMGIIGSSVRDNIETLTIVPRFKSVLGDVSSLEIIDYVYGYLHDGDYIAQYNEVLKLDLPRVPYPIDKDHFNKYCGLGKKLREIHYSLEPSSKEPIHKVLVGSDFKVGRISYSKGNVYLNETTYFKDVPYAVWAYRIGEFNAVQAWVKDRRGRLLSSDELGVFSNILGVVKETLLLTDPDSLNIKGGDECGEDTLF